MRPFHPLSYSVIRCECDTAVANGPHWVKQPVYSRSAAFKITHNGKNKSSDSFYLLCYQNSMTSSIKLSRLLKKLCIGRVLYDMKTPLSRADPDLKLIHMCGLSTIRNGYFMRIICTIKQNVCLQKLKAFTLKKYINELLAVFFKITKYNQIRFKYHTWIE